MKKYTISGEIVLKFEFEVEANDMGMAEAYADHASCSLERDGIYIDSFGEEFYVSYDEADFDEWYEAEYDPDDDDEDDEDEEEDDDEDEEEDEEEDDDEDEEE